MYEGLGTRHTHIQFERYPPDIDCVQMWGCSKGSGVPHGYKCNVTCEPPCLKLNLEQQSAGTLCIRLNASTTSMDSPSISGRAGGGGGGGGGGVGANWKGGGGGP